MARKKDVLDRLAERLARGEISESTYLSIKERYEKEGFPEEDESDRYNIRIDLSAIQEALNGISDVLPSIHRGDYEGERYDCCGVGKVAGKLKVGDARVVGVCKIADDLEANTLETSGTLKVGDDILVDDFKNSGVLSVGGSIKSNVVESSGQLRVQGDVEADTFKNSGACKVTKSVKSSEVTLSGALKVGQNVEADSFNSTGSFRVGGAIKASKIDIELTSRSRASSIEGDDIRVRAAAGGGRLMCETIKGSKVHLEATDADLVEGDDVEIGPRCRVRKVVASSLKAHETAEIEEKQVGEAEESPS